MTQSIRMCVCMNHQKLLNIFLVKKVAARYEHGQHERDSTG